MRGKMLFVSIALLVMVFFLGTTPSQVNVGSLNQLHRLGTRYSGGVLAVSALFTI